MNPACQFYKRKTAEISYKRENKIFHFFNY